MANLEDCILGILIKALGVLRNSVSPDQTRDGSLRCRPRCRKLRHCNGERGFGVCLEESLDEAAKPLEIPDEPIQSYVQISPCLLSKSGHCTYIFICRSGSWKAISFRSGSTLFSILRSKAKVRTDVISSFFLSLSFHSRRVMVYVGDVYELDKGIRPMCAGVTWWNDIYVCLGRYIVSCWVMWQSRVGMIHRRSGHAACLACPRSVLFDIALLDVLGSTHVGGFFFCQRRPGILKTHCFGLVAGDKCHDIADHFSYVGSGCQMYSVNGEGGGSSSR
ncbi:hypothetical protein DY000_02015577 [Brassica cretica]|uniref:Uncharacterized protein n=1 Tax=Brassica cretica TaxID=69181 RepID=A0ABQ7CPZ7_BRACR|nr:hypothetical protein DY000_02015577 [Brassica cretica]